MLQGEQQSAVELSFSIPSVCATRVEQGSVDVGLVPVAEIARQDLAILSDVGIACHGAVRSILLISQTPLRQIRTLAADLSSRTSVQLAKVILQERYGVQPDIRAERPLLDRMLATADAALIIGDPALRLDPDALPFETLDLGAEWLLLTGLPMVFAAWAAKSRVSFDRVRQLTRASYEDGKRHLAAIVESEFHDRRISRDLAATYLSRFIQYELGPSELDGLQTFWKLAGLSSNDMTTAGAR